MNCLSNVTSGPRNRARTGKVQNEAASSMDAAVADAVVCQYQVGPSKVLFLEDVGTCPLDATSGWDGARSSIASQHSVVVPEHNSAHRAEPTSSLGSANMEMLRSLIDQRNDGRPTEPNALPSQAQPIEVDAEAVARPGVLIRVECHEEKARIETPPEDWAREAIDRNVRSRRGRKGVRDSADEARRQPRYAVMRILCRDGRRYPVCMSSLVVESPLCAGVSTVEGGADALVTYREGPHAKDHLPEMAPCAEGNWDPCRDSTLWRTRWGAEGESPAGPGSRLAEEEAYPDRSDVMGAKSADARVQHMGRRVFPWVSSLASLVAQIWPSRRPSWVPRGPLHADVALSQLFAIMPHALVPKLEACDRSSQRCRCERSRHADASCPAERMLCRSDKGMVVRQYVFCARFNAEWAQMSALRSIRASLTRDLT